MRWSIVVLMFFSGLAQGHRSHFGWTEINLNANTVEIVHRFHEHDAALLVSKLANTAADINQLESQARFALYLEQHFILASPAGHISLNLVGAELKGKYLFVYQEVPADEIPKQLTIEADMMMDLFEDQIHLVNIKLPNFVQTVEFTRDSKPQTLAADHADTY
jgi:hypothetical protein